MAPILSKPIPFDRVDIETWKLLAQLLEPLSQLSKPGDWRTLASSLLYDTKWINYIQSVQKVDGSCTMELFRQYSKRADSSVEGVMDALEVMQHVTARKILDQIYPDLRQEYDRVLQMQNEVGDIPTKMTPREDKRHRLTADQRNVKRPCPASRRGVMRTREGQENSHHSPVSSSGDRCRQTPVIRRVSSVDSGTSVLPHIGVFSNNNEEEIQSMDISSMDPEYTTVQEEEIENETDINHNGIMHCNGEDFVPLEGGIARQLFGDQCDIGAEEEVVTSTTSSSGSPVTSLKRTTHNRQNVICLNKNTQSGGQMVQNKGFQQPPASMEYHRCQSMGTTSKAGARDVNNTYPRMKQQGGGDARGPSRVASIPIDMKFSQYRENSRQIRIFITYSNDSQIHLSQVISLADCLKKNSFSVSIDMFEFHLMAIDKVGWLETRFRDADFVLVCISDQYRHDVDAMDDEGTISVDHSLNTKFIYKLMQTEYHERCSTNYRFIPLLFPGVTKDHVPTWLQNTLIYSWPAQFRDLFFFLSKPDKFINRSLKSGHNSSVKMETHPTIITRSYSNDSNTHEEFL